MMTILQIIAALWFLFGIACSVYLIVLIATAKHPPPPNVPRWLVWGVVAFLVLVLLVASPICAAIGNIQRWRRPKRQ